MSLLSVTPDAIAQRELEKEFARAFEEQHGRPLLEPESESAAGARQLEASSQAQLADLLGVREDELL